jgi:MFS family permease
LLWTSETVSGLGNSITRVVLPLISVVDLKVGAFGVGLLGAAVWSPWLVIGLPVGAWVDRFRRRPLMVGCNLVSAASFASVPIAWWWHALTFGHLLGVAVLSGTAAVVFSTACHAYVPAVLAGHDLVEGNAKLQGSESATQVAGPGAGGLLAQGFGGAAGLLVDALTFLVATVCLVRIGVREPVRTAPAHRETLRRQIGSGLRFVARDPYLRPLVAYGSAVNLALTGYQTVQIVFLVETVGIDPSVVGALLTAASVGGVLGALAARPVGRRFGTARGMLLSQMVTAPVGLLMPLATPGAGLVFFVAGSLTVVAGIVACNVVLSGFRQRYCPPHLLGRVIATTMFLNHSTIPLGALLGGTLGAVTGPRTTMWIMAGLLALCWLVLAAGPMRRVRDLPTHHHDLRPHPHSGAAATAVHGATSTRADTCEPR